jgi:hypothetical protein
MASSVIRPLQVLAAAIASSFSVAKTLAVIPRTVGAAEASQYPPQQISRLSPQRATNLKSGSLSGKVSLTL